MIVNKINVGHFQIMTERDCYEAKRTMTGAWVVYHCGDVAHATDSLGECKSWVRKEAVLKALQGGEAW